MNDEQYVPVLYMGLVAPNETLSIRPGLTEQWELAAIYYSGTVTLVRTDSVNRITLATTITTKQTIDMKALLTVYSYIEVINKDAATITVAYQAKAPL